jgi:hypothetical protein
LLRRLAGTGIAEELSMVRLSLLAVLLLGGCGSVAGPIIDDLEMPQAAQVGADGFYSVEGLLSFHDESGALSKIRIRVPSVGQSFDFDASSGLSRGTLPLVVKFSSASPKGPMEYDVSLVDAAGSSSSARAAFVTLQ